MTTEFCRLPDGERRLQGGTLTATLQALLAAMTRFRELLWHLHLTADLIGDYPTPRQLQLLMEELKSLSRAERQRFERDLERLHLALDDLQRAIKLPSGDN